MVACSRPRSEHGLQNPRSTSKSAVQEVMAALLCLIIARSIQGGGWQSSSHVLVLSHKRDARVVGPRRYAHLGGGGEYKGAFLGGIPRDITEMTRVCSHRHRFSCSPPLLTDTLQHGRGCILGASLTTSSSCGNSVLQQIQQICKCSRSTPCDEGKAGIAPQRLGVQLVYRSGSTLKRTRIRCQFTLLNTVRPPEMLLVGSALGAS